MFKCKCGKEFEKSTSLNSHARFCDLYKKKQKITTANFFKNGIFKCKCGKEFEKSTSLITHFGHCIVYNNKQKNYEKLNGKYKTPWNKGLTKLENESLKRAGEKISLLPGSFLGKHHSKETRQKISEKMSERNNGIVKCKYYEIFCPYENSNIKV